MKKKGGDEEDEEDDNEMDEENWDDFEEDESNHNNNSVICLLCSSKFPSSSLVIEHMRSHGFDLLGLIFEMKLDFFARIKLINYIRRKVAEDEKFDFKQIKKEDFR